MRGAKPKPKRAASKIVWTGNRRSMEHSDFRIGCEFLTGSGRWRCTDVGKRTIAAIKLDLDHDPTWYIGPPYKIAESLFDECDIEGCEAAPRRRSFDDSGRARIVIVPAKGLRKRARSRLPCE
jgi:hypothetical protein